MISKYDAYLVGHYGMQNSGDDALLLATLYGAQSVLGCKKCWFLLTTKRCPAVLALTSRRFTKNRLLKVRTE